MDVIQEDLRSICVWKIMHDLNMGSIMWWNYATLFDDNCGVRNSSQNFNQQCSFKQMDKLIQDASIGLDGK